jgi:hypothetical protein
MSQQKSSRLCRKCHQLLSPMTDVNFFDHITKCKGVDPDAPIGVTFHYVEDMMNRVHEQPVKHIRATIMERPQTRG